ncbi:MAG TPA: hypothetical protein VNT31_17070 [Nocardioides sp.]|nr:hypothetical protein [Nocardioides sp.]
MRSRRVPAAVAGACALAWLTLMTGYGAAAAEPHEAADLGGEPVPGGTGSTSPDDPTALDPGLWADTLGGSSTRNTHHFSYSRRMKDSTVHVGVVGAPQSGESDAVKVDVGVLGEEGDLVSCATDDSSTTNVPEALIGAAVAVGPSSAESTERTDCLRAGTLQIAVSRAYSSNTSEIPVAIKVVEEAPVTGAASLPAAEETVTFPVPDAGSARELPGAWSFEEAPALDARAGGATVATTLVQGDEQLWRVPVQWGQQVAVRATTPALGEAELEGICCGVPVRLRIIDPRRAVFAYNNDTEGEVSDGTYGGEAGELVAGSAPLRYLNRYDDDLPVVPGDFWVALSTAPLDPSAEREPLEFEVELTVAVTGRVAGEPSYPGVVVSPDDSAGPDGYSPDTPFLVADGVFSAVASGNPVVGDDEAGWLTGRRWAGIGLGVVSAACLAAGVVRLRSAR